jgi:Ca2+-binding EF-hand superfamily protein
MSISAIGSGSSGLSATYFQQLQQQLFAKLDSNGDGQITKTELESALAGQGVSTAQADSLFDALGGDSSSTGTLTDAQFSAGLQQLLLDSQSQGQAIQAQSDQTSIDSATNGPASTTSLSNLFDQLTGGTGTLTQSELEQAYVSQGGTTQQADALFSQLDTQGTGAVTQSQFVAGMQQIFAEGAEAQSAESSAESSTSSSSTASLSALFDQLTGGSGELTQSELEQAFASQGGTTQEADALYSQLDPQGTGSVSESQFVSGMQQILAQGPQAPGAAPSTAPNATTALSNLFDQLTGGSGELTQSELEQAFVSQGGTTQQADSLFSQLDPSGASSISEQQFVSGIQQLFAQAAQNQSGQTQSTQTQSASSSATSSLSALFDQLTDGSGQLTEAELEQAFVSQGGTTQEADALFSQLDPSGASSISEAQFVSGMQQILGQGAPADQPPVASSSTASTASLGSATDSGQSASAAGQATTTVTVNPDGSTTTTVTYANGTVVTTTTPAADTNSSASSGNGLSTMLLASTGNLSGLVDQKTVNALLGLLDVPQAA